MNSEQIKEAIQNRALELYPIKIEWRNGLEYDVNNFSRLDFTQGALFALSLLNLDKE